MDKKLLEALNNLSFALEAISEAMKDSTKDKNKSATAAALTGGKIEKKLELIDKGIKEIQSDNKKILKNQEELLKLAKQQKQSGPVGDASDPKQRNKIKDGLGTIMLIAVGVLAIGMAFKIIGKINFVSVLALAMALPIIAIAFERIAKMKDLKIAQMKTLVILVTMMSAAIVISSYILGLVKPVGIFKLFTATLISGLFVVLSHALPKILEGFSKVNTMGVAKMILFGPLVLLSMSLAIAWSSSVLQLVRPVGIFKMITAVMISAAFVGLSYSLPKILGAFSKVGPMSVAKMILFGPAVLLALSVAIALSSHALQFVKPVGIFKLFTAILISIAFAAIGFGLGKIVGAFGKMKIDPAKAAAMAILMPLIFVGLAWAIAGASEAFQFIKPVGIFKLFTAVLIAIVFIPLAYGLQFLGKAMSYITVKQALLLPVVLVLLATAIMLSSYIFQLTQILPWQTLLNIVFQAVALAAIGLILGTAMKFIAKIAIKDVLMGSLILLVLVTAIMLTSWILSVGNYGNYPSAAWAGGVGLSIILFAPAVVLLGLLAMADGGLSQLLGAVMVLVLALAITGVSHILATGKYDLYPPVTWTASVLLTMVPFAIMTVALGAIALSGIGAIAFGLGIPMIMGVAYTIVEVSKILGQGKYDLPGLASWTISVIAIFTTFTPLLLVLGAIALANAVLSVFGANPWESARAMIVQIAETIVDVADVFAGGNFTGGPTLEWAGGVAIAMGAFAPLYSMLVASKIMDWLGGGGIGPEDFNQAIRTVVGGIMFAAEAFAGTSAFTGGPKKEWSEGVGLAIGAFAPVYDILSRSKVSKKGVTVEEFTNGIMITCQGILDAATFFGNNIAAFDLDKVPKKEWGEAVGGAIKAFLPALEYIQKSAGWFSDADPEIIKKGITLTAQGIVDAAWYLRQGKYDATITIDWVKQTAGGIKEFTNLAQWLQKNQKKGQVENLNRFIESISSAAGALARVDWSKTITPEWVNNTRSGIIDYIDLAIYVGKQEGLNGNVSVSRGVFGGGFYAEGSLGKLHNVVGSMVKISEDFKKIVKNTSRLDDKWMLNVSRNVRRYVHLAMWLSGSAFDSFIVYNAVQGMRRVTNSYSQLARAVDRLNESLAELDVEKLNALRNLNASVVLMSLMDPDQFKSMMEELEDKGGFLIEALEKVESKEKEDSSKSKKTSTTPVKTSGSGGGSAGKTMTDLYTILEAVNKNLGAIATDSKNLAKVAKDLIGKDPLPE